MDQKIKEKWIEALRSGNYQQGRQQLKTWDNKFCCLGVLCDLYKKEKPDTSINWLRGDLPHNVEYWAEVNGTDFELTSYVRASAKLDHQERMVFPKGSLVDLVTLNDDGLNFRQIADIIEEHF